MSVNKLLEYIKDNGMNELFNNLPNPKKKVIVQMSNTEFEIFKKISKTNWDNAVNKIIERYVFIINLLNKFKIKSKKLYKPTRSKLSDLSNTELNIIKNLELSKWDKYFKLTKKEKDEYKKIINAKNNKKANLFLNNDKSRSDITTLYTLNHNINNDYFSSIKNVGPVTNIESNKPIASNENRKKLIELMSININNNMRNLELELIQNDVIKMSNNQVINRIKEIEELNMIKEKNEYKKMTRKNKNNKTSNIPVKSNVLKSYTFKCKKTKKSVS